MSNSAAVARSPSTPSAIGSTAVSPTSLPPHRPPDPPRPSPAPPRLPPPPSSRSISVPSPSPPLSGPGTPGRPLRSNWSSPTIAASASRPASIPTRSIRSSTSWRAGRDQPPAHRPHLPGHPAGRHAPRLRRPGRLGHLRHRPGPPLRSSLRLPQSPRRPPQDPVLGPGRPGHLGEAIGARHLPLPGSTGRPARGHARRDGRHPRGHRPEPRPPAEALRPTGDDTTSRRRSDPIIHGKSLATSPGSVRNRGMTTSCDELPTDLETCHQLIRELIATLRQQTSLNERLQHQLERLLRRVYGQ